jgi:hypothetical protein
MKNKWTKEELTKHIEVNVEDYGAIIVVSALFFKLYGELPEVGLSGYQGENAINLSKKLPLTKTK